MSVMEETTYRVAILPDLVKVELVGIGALSRVSLNKITEGWYSDVQELPKWAQERVAILMMCRLHTGDDVPGVGRRISDDIFWIYA